MAQPSGLDSGMITGSGWTKAALPSEKLTILIIIMKTKIVLLSAEIVRFQIYCINLGVILGHIPFAPKVSSIDNTQYNALDIYSTYTVYTVHTQ